MTNVDFALLSEQFLFCLSIGKSHWSVSEGSSSLVVQLMGEKKSVLIEEEQILKSVEIQ